MRILALLDDRPDGPGAQDMLSQATLLGLCRAFGTSNVCDYWAHEGYRGATYSLQQWPVFLGALAFYGHPECSRAGFDEFDAHVVSTRFITHAVEEGLCSAAEHEEILAQIDHEKLILVNATDDPAGVDPDLFGGCRLWVERPGRADLPPRGFLAHIAVPLEHIWHQRAKASAEVLNELWGSSSVWAAWNDNGPVRRELMKSLVAANICGSSLRWGSAAGYHIEWTDKAIGPPYYYAEMASARVCVSARGCNADCLRTWEILATGRPLVTDDFGFSSDFRDGQECLYYRNAAECVEQVRWALEHPEQAEAIGRRGKEVYLRAHTPSRQAWAMLDQAGLL